MASMHWELSWISLGITGSAGRLKPGLNLAHGFLHSLAFGNAMEPQPPRPLRSIYLKQRKRKTSMLEFLKTWLELKYDRRAVTALEYGLIAGAIAAVIAVTVVSMGTSIEGKFTTIAAEL